MILIIIISTMVPLILILLNSFLFKKEMNSREKLSSFECGFDPQTSSRAPFSIRFYLMAVIFLIFDIEITLILPIPLIISFNNPPMWISMAVLFMLILLGGLLHEWNQGALNWAN